MADQSAPSTSSHFTVANASDTNSNYSVQTPGRLTESDHDDAVLPKKVSDLTGMVKIRNRSPSDKLVLKLVYMMDGESKQEKLVISQFALGLEDVMESPGKSYEIPMSSK